MASRSSSDIDCHRSEDIQRPACPGVLNRPPLPLPRPLPLIGPAWTWIQDYEKKRDGRGAWMALQAHFEGVSGQIRLKAAAYCEPVAETKKVKDFLDGITEPSLQPVRYTIAGFPHLMNNFTEAANYISQIIDFNRKTESITRQVSATGTVGRGGRGHGGRGRTHGDRGGKGGRGGNKRDLSESNTAWLSRSK
jgi:hypothetical protein